MTALTTVPPLWQSLVVAALARKPAIRAEREIDLEKASYQLEGPAVVARGLVRFFALPVESIPLVAWYVVAQRAQLAYMTARSFPFSAIGTIHVANTIELFDQVDPYTRLQADVRLGNQSLTSTGRRFSLIVTLKSVAGSAVVSSDYIARDPRLKSERKTVAEQPNPPSAEAQRLEYSTDLGRRYARVAGDYNPIHLAAVLARPLGFRHAIAHGMCTFGFASAILARRLQGEQRFGQVDFKRPIPLPSRPTFFVDSGPLSTFEVWSDDQTERHASGSFRVHKDI